MLGWRAKAPRGRSASFPRGEVPDLVVLHDTELLRCPGGWGDRNGVRESRTQIQRLGVPNCEARDCNFPGGVGERRSSNSSISSSPAAARPVRVGGAAPTPSRFSSSSGKGNLARAGSGVGGGFGGRALGSAGGGALAAPAAGEGSTSGGDSPTSVRRAGTRVTIVVGGRGAWIHRLSRPLWARSNATCCIAADSASTTRCLERGCVGAEVRSGAAEGGGAGG